MAKNRHFTARVIELKGDPRNPESAQTIVKFPGGSIEVSRCSNGRDYWAHIDVHDQEIIDEAVRESAQGTIIESRVDYVPAHRELGIANIPNAAKARHIAVLIRTGRLHG
jgi:hypothetical protein